MSFVHLHVHTEYSPDAISKIDELFIRAENLGMPGLAITDHGTISGVPEFLKTAERHPAVKPIVGCEFWLAEKDEVTYHLILLAKNLTGYKNLVELVSYANTEGFYYKPRITREKLIECHEGLICTSACIGGEVPRMIIHDKLDEAQKAAQWYKDLFGEDFYLEVSLHKNFGPIKLAITDDRSAYKKNNQNLVELQKLANTGIFQLADELGIKVVATNDVHFVTREDGIAHDVMLAIQHDKKVSDPGRIRYSHLEYLKTEDEMRRLFPEHPEVIENTLDVMEKVERYSIWNAPRLPKVSDDPDKELREKVTAGAIKRFGQLSPEQQKRIDDELQAIEEKGFAGYFLMIEDVVNWVRSKGWIVGPGRGAAAGSLVNYCLGITEIDPMKHGLLFERLVHSDRLALLNIDLDMEPEAELHIKDYLKEKYGRDCISGITVFGKYGQREALRKAGKALGISASTIKRLSSRLSDYYYSLAWNIQYNDAIRNAYYSGTDALRQAFDVACKLSNVIEDETIHSCGWLVAPSPLCDIVPVQIQEGWMNEEHTLNSMYDAWRAEEVGVLRLNFLTLRELRVIKDAVRAIEERDSILIDPVDIPLDDFKTLDLFARGDTVGVFQFGSEGMRENLQQLKDPTFDALAALNALYRPGSMDWIPEFLEGTPGDDHYYIISCMKEVLDRTNGMLVYQEQMMTLSSRIAGFTTDEANRLRKAAGKKKQAELDDLQKKFIKGGMEKGYPEHTLELIWNVFETRGIYLFNQSHSYCYTFIGYQMAWLKAHYPIEFFTALLNGYMDVDWAVEEFIRDCEAHFMTVIPPDASRSGMFEVTKS